MTSHIDPALIALLVVLIVVVVLLWSKPANGSPRPIPVRPVLGVLALVFALLALLGPATWPWLVYAVLCLALMALPF
jgi:hypothetical protein